MRATAILALALAACATPPPAPRVTQPWDVPKQPALPVRQPAPAAATGAAAEPEAPLPARAETTPAEVARLVDANPDAWAARFATKGADCEATSRALRPTNANTAWRALKACVAKTDFKSFRRLTEGFWDADLQARPDAAQLLGAIIAARGGDVPTDLAVLRKRRIPLFTLENATDEPEIYRGRAVAFVARVEELEKGAKGKVSVTLSELSVVSRSTGQTTEARYTEYKRQDEHGRKYTERGYRDGTVTRTHYATGLDETGVEVKASLARPDPFFTPGATFLVVARFDGMLPVEFVPDSTQPGVTILAYYTIGKESLLD
jgi:hypothetical protein